MSNEKTSKKVVLVINGIIFGAWVGLTCLIGIMIGIGVHLIVEFLK